MDWMQRAREGLAVVADVWTLFGAVIIAGAVALYALISANSSVLGLVVLAIAIVGGSVLAFHGFLRYYAGRPDVTAQYVTNERGVTYEFDPVSPDRITFTIEQRIRSKVPELAFIQQKFQWSGRSYVDAGKGSRALTSDGAATVVWSPFVDFVGTTFHALVLERPMRRGETRTITTVHELSQAGQSPRPELSLRVSKKMKVLSLTVVFPPHAIPVEVRAERFKGSVYQPSTARPLEYDRNDRSGEVAIKVTRPKRNHTYRIRWS